MNEFDIECARRRFTRACTPNRLALVMVVEHLAEWANNNSDGWAYWPKPCRAAEQVISLIESRTYAENKAQEDIDITDAVMRAAVKPIKAFLTRHKVRSEDREIILRSVS
jgi:hypothetical protein